MGITSQLAASRLIQPGVCTSSTRPASPFEGQAIYETDTDRMLVYTGSAWKYTWFASPPAFYAGITYSTTISAGAVIPFNSATVNSGSHYDTSNGRFTAPVDGLYWFSTRILTQNDTNVADIRFYKNGGVYSAYAGFTMVPSGGGSQHRQVHIQGVMPLAPGDYITVNAYSAGTVSLYGSTAENHSAFTGYWLGN